MNSIKTKRPWATLLTWRIVLASFYFKMCKIWNSSKILKIFPRFQDLTMHNTIHKKKHIFLHHKLVFDASTEQCCCPSLQWIKDDKTVKWTMNNYRKWKKVTVTLKWTYVNTCLLTLYKTKGTTLFPENKNLRARLPLKLYVQLWTHR